MKEGIECYNLLLVNYIGYQNSRLVHKPQLAGRHVVALQVICSKPRPLARPQHSLKVNSSWRLKAIIITNEMMYQSW